jgi:hypothetical protein
MRLARYLAIAGRRKLVDQIKEGGESSNHFPGLIKRFHLNPLAR